MNKSIYLFLSILWFGSCKPQNTEQLLYESKAFRVFSDRVEQQDFTARAIDRAHMVSDYVSPAQSEYSSLLNFKFSINGKDNEAPEGKNHTLNVVPSQKGLSPVIKFGEFDSPTTDDAEVTNLSPNTEYTIRVDLGDVLSEMKEKGFFTTFNGQRIRQSDFTGVYIAGGSAPLSWDFDNLKNTPSYQLQDNDGDGIFEGTFVLNPQDTTKSKERKWTLTRDITKYPSYESDQVLVDALYNMSLDETIMDIEQDGTFRTGEEWAGVWTRDISYSIILAYAFLEPEVSKTSLMRKVKRNRIIQDTGSGGAWPVSSDRVVWSLAAWEIYQATGDKQWLEKTFEIVSNSIEDDLATTYDTKKGLFKGESSFLDWREQTYPSWMDNVDISQSKNLGTNIVFYETLNILSKMAERLKDVPAFEKYSALAASMKARINEQFWNEERGYFNQYLYGRIYMDASPRSEALGEALSVIFKVPDGDRAESIIQSTPIVDYGVPCIFPQIPNQPPYHNNGIWPFVQAYWNWAAKETGNEKAVEQGLASIYRPAAMFLTNKENFVAENGDYIGTQINSNRQLWSVAGNLAMVYRVFFGMNFQTDGLHFTPFVPKAYSGSKKIQGFNYRESTLNITLSGTGNVIESFKLDGESMDSFVIPVALEGKHTVEIILTNEEKKGSKINLVDNAFSPAMPVVSVTDQSITWGEDEQADHYVVYRNGEKEATTKKANYALADDAFGQYKVVTVSKEGLESFASEPVEVYPNDRLQVLQLEDFANKSNLSLVDFGGKGFVEITKERNKVITIPWTMFKSGKYAVAFRYSNGSGPWNTDNKCAIRTLKVDGKKAGTIVMAQRGKDEWSNWGITNYITLKNLEPGRHVIQVVWEETNENMNVGVNRAMLDYMKIIQL